MISGRGGTGKTEVVSAVLGYAEREIDYVGDVNVCMFIKSPRSKSCEKAPIKLSESFRLLPKISMQHIFKVNVIDKIIIMAKLIHKF